ncbi:hypothetical protein [Rhodoplanes sp. Z2-YC6860]|uniref:hypothetical protein n=1 Tax=Rhodoplanes sp. Z2-YC6860 TaxID=674703 RepID=UPI00078CB2EE|nr:hypothetical protein [Rhodoplanes sp. Z2-YC6860]AMN44106.1 lipase [Rhodoplanes sp. Z2-YC6860]
MAAQSVRRRKVFYIAGYDPGAAAGFYRRFLRQLEIFKRTWCVESKCSERSIFEQGSTWSVTTSCRDWSVQTDFVLLSWDDLIAKEASGPALRRFSRGAAVYADLILSGTLHSYFKANPRYFAFAIAPFFQIAALLILSFVVGFAVSSGLPPPWSSFSGAIAAMAAFIVFQHWLGRRWRMHQALDDWIMSLDYIRKRRDELETRISRFANLISAATCDNAADEILVVGHSLGATFAADALSQALCLKGVAVAFASLGATIPKCTLHPDASWLRDRIAGVARNPTVSWVEIQTRADPISFFRVHPVSLKRVHEANQLPSDNPVIRRARLQQMLEPATYKKIRWRPLRLHYQCVSANERKAPYDFFMMICGPAPVAMWSKSEFGLMNIGHDPEAGDPKRVVG